MLIGKVFKFGDNIDTDLILPARYLVTTDSEILKHHCMEDISTSFAKEVKAGDFILGGENFGCGSSREQAVLAILGCGVKAILAESFARIFYRNSINRGLYLLEISKDTLRGINEGDTLQISLDKGEIICSNGKKFIFKPISSEMREIVEAGGIINYTKSRLVK